MFETADKHYSDEEIHELVTRIWEWQWQVGRSVLDEINAQCGAQAAVKGDAVHSRATRCCKRWRAPCTRARSPPTGGLGAAEPMGGAATR
jgi:hypothetical protein